MPISEPHVVQIARLERALARQSFGGISAAIGALERIAPVRSSRELRQAIRVAVFMCNRAADATEVEERAAFQAGAVRAIGMLKTLFELERLLVAAPTAILLDRRERYAGTNVVPMRSHALRQRR